MEAVVDHLPMRLWCAGSFYYSLRGGDGHVCVGDHPEPRLRRRSGWYGFAVSAVNNRRLAPTWEPGPGIIQLADGRRIRARGLETSSPPGPAPQLGLYLLAHRPPAMDWEQRWLPWRNYWLPGRRQAAAALCEAFERSATERVEVACEAGTGRTGTALACLAVLAGTPVEDAVPYVRYRYDDRAVRAPWQRLFVRWFAKHAVG